MEQHQDYGTPQWGGWHRGVSVQDVQRKEEPPQFQVDSHAFQYSIIISTAIVVLVILMPFILAVLTTPKKVKRVKSNAARELVYSDSEAFLESVDALPFIQKFNKFHKEAKGKKAKAVELIIRPLSRTTLYSFPDNSLLEIHEKSSAAGVMEEINFKSL